MSDSGSPALDVRGLGHRFKNHVALADVTFQVSRQCIHGFVGPNKGGECE